ncbi:hypothetical protein ACFFRR_005568 [Megaselia abdita]
MDLKVGSKFVAALINTNRSTTKLDNNVYNFLKVPYCQNSMGKETMLFPLTLKTDTFIIPCEHVDSVKIEVGMDALAKMIPTLKLDGLFLKPFLAGRPSINVRYIIYPLRKGR